ncbi:MAG: hypothetical protein HOY69_02015, partial [Streptomyces sp.]|nr:hypothetical protein [Streptomyces sp.]
MKSVRQALSSAPRAAVALCAALGLALGGLFALSPVPAARADTTQICDPNGTSVQTHYVIQNNVRTAGQTQCLAVGGSGRSFQVTQADGSVPTDGPAKSYPSIYNGCYRGLCSPGTTLPMQLSAITSARSTVYFIPVTDAVFDASYDVWLDPTPRKDGVNRTRIAVWFDQLGSIVPIGSEVGTVTLASLTWDVWIGNDGSSDVLTFVSARKVSNWNFDVRAFTNEAVSRGLAQPNWYLTSVQAGFEPWQNGTGLSVGCFQSSVNTGEGTAGSDSLGQGNTDGGSSSGEGVPVYCPLDPTPTTGTTTGDTTAGSVGGGSSGSTTSGSGTLTCTVTYSPQTWPGGFTTSVTLANTGSTALIGWNLGFTLPAGQTVTNAWGATVSPSSGAVTATNLDYDAQIPAGGSVSFGFQGTWT